MNTFDLTLDLDKSAGVTQWVAIRQGDKSGTTIRATIYDHGTALSGNYTARICMRLPDGTHFYEKDATLSGNVATVTIDETQAASVSGLTHNAYFQIIQGSTVVASTQDFTVKVLRDAMSDAEVGENYSIQIEQAVESLEDMTSTIPTKVKDEVDAQLAAHPEWTTTVQDNSLTDAKLIQHGGILDRVARLWHRLDNLLTATPAEADALTVTDAAKTPLAGLALYGRSTQDGTPTPSAPVAIQSITPNLLDPSTFVVRPNSVDTIVDGFVSDSTPTVDSSGWTWASRTFECTLPAGTYTVCFSVRVAGGSDSSYTVMTSADVVIKARGNGFLPYTFTLGETTTIGIKIKTYAAVVACMIFEGTHTNNQMPYIPYGRAGLFAVGQNLISNSSDSYSLTGSSFARYLPSSVDLSSVGRLTFSIAGSVPSTQTLALFGPINGQGNDFFGNLTRQSDGRYAVTISESNMERARHVTEWRIYSQPYTGGSSVVTTLYDAQMQSGTTATAYQPYAESTTPIDLQGHALRSLPDGTRDEVNVDQYGHAVLTQRVGSYTVTGNESVTPTSLGDGWYRVVPNVLGSAPSVNGSTAQQGYCSHAPFSWTPTAKSQHAGTQGTFVLLVAQESTGAAILALYAGAEITYALATPVTIDLGTIDPVALQGPDMTAQSVPTAPFALTYERDLNTTLARLEAAIAEVATS